MSFGFHSLTKFFRPTPRSEQNKKSGGWTRRLPFDVKMSLHMMVMIFFTIIALTAVLPYQYRNEIYQRETDTPLTSFAVINHYLSSHYQLQANRFVPSQIDYMLRTDFLRIDGRSIQTPSLFPTALVLYDLGGKVLHQFEKVPTNVQWAQNKKRADLPLSFNRSYNPIEQQVYVAGPIKVDNKVVGYVDAIFPSRIGMQLTNLYKHSLLVMVVVIFIAVVVSLLFARNALSPIRALTQAARRVHRGDFDQRLVVHSDDEIGELTRTFNDMVSTLARRISNMHALQECTVHISRELEQERLLEVLADAFVRMSGSSACRFYMVDDVEDRLDILAERNPEALPAPDQDQLTALAIEERWTMFLKTDGKMDSEPQDVREIAIPLLAGQNRVGVIRVGAKWDHEAFDDETLTLLQTLAQHASIAIDNAKLYEQLAEKERIEQEMALARDIQQAMFPRQVPSLPGYEIAGGSKPAFEVGGDYYDVVKSLEDQWHFIIGDVSGKGVPAAMIMSIVRSFFHAFIEFESSPETIMKRLNKGISQNIEPEMFVTLSAINLNPNTHQVRLARAGHEPLLILNPHGEIKHLSPPGVAVGLLEPEQFDQILEEQSFTLEAHETLLLYTDGITEAQNEQGEEFGLDRLLAIFRQSGSSSANDIYSAIHKEIASFSKGQLQNDDMTLLVVRRTS